MKLHFNDSRLLTGARLLDPQYLTLIFGTRHTIELDCVAGAPEAPVDVAALGCVKWALVITPGWGDNTELFSKIYDAGCCVGSTITLDLQILTPECFGHIQGRKSTKALFVLKGWTDAEDASSLTVNVQLPCYLESNEAAKPRYDAVAAIAAAYDAQQSAIDAKASEDAAALSERNAADSASAAGVSEHNAGVAMEYAQSARDDADRSAQAAQAAESQADTYAITAKSYAVGGTSSRTGEDTDNAKYYKEQADAAKTAAETAEGHAQGYAQDAAGSATSAANDAAITTDNANAAIRAAANAANDALTVARYLERTVTAKDQAVAAEGNATTAASAAQGSASDAAASARDAAASAQSASEDASYVRSAVSDAQGYAQSASDDAAAAGRDAGSASQSAASAGGSATLSQSWAVGGTNTRAGEDTNNAKYWSDQAQAAAGGGTWGSITGDIDDQTDLQEEFATKAPAPITATTDPTTSTEGELTQFLRNSTNGKVFQCVGIDNSDPNAIVYSWEQYIPASEKGAANGVAELDANGKLMFNQLPVLQGDAAPTTVTVGQFGQLYMSKENNAANPNSRRFYICFGDNNGSYVWHNIATSSSSSWGQTSFAGTVKVPNPNENLGICSSDGRIYVEPANNSQIDGKTILRKPIVPSTLDYAVRSVLRNVTVIPSATSAYSLLDSSATTNNHSHTYVHVPESAPTYTLPAVTDNTTVHVIQLVVSFTGYSRDTDDDGTGYYAWKSGSTILYTSTDSPTAGTTKAYTDTALTTEAGTIASYANSAISLVASLAFQDSNEVAITPLFTPSISAGDTYRFDCEWSNVQQKWLIYPVKEGLVASDYVMRGEVGAANGVASLNSSGRLTSSQMPYDPATTYGVYIYGNYLATYPAKENVIDARAGNASTAKYQPICPERLNYAVAAALSDANKMQLTDAQKASAQDTLGVGAAPIVFTTAGDTPTTSTVGTPGRRAVNTADGKAWTCTAVTNTGTEAEPAWSYTWTDDINANGGTIVNNVLKFGYTGSSFAANISAYNLFLGLYNTYGTGTSGCIIFGEGCKANNNIKFCLVVGTGLTASNSKQVIFGQYNISNVNAMRIVGMGADSNSKLNIEELDNSGNLYIAGGYEQGITTIPAATSAYTLTDGGSKHSPSSAPTYTLPDVPQRVIANGVYFTRNTATDGTGYYGWLNGTTNRYTSSAAPAVGDNTYTNTALTQGARAITAIDERTHECILSILFRGYYRSSTDDSGSAYAWKATDGSLLYTDTTTVTAGTTLAYTDTALTESAGTIALYDSVKSAFSMVGSYSFEDAAGNAIVPLSTPTIEVGSVVTFLCRWEALLGQWVIMPIPVGTEQTPAA